MKQTTLSIPYDEAKIDALRHFTDAGKPALEDEIAALIDKIYARNVPAPVRDFITAQAESPSSGSANRRKKKPDVTAKPPQMEDDPDDDTKAHY